MVVTERNQMIVNNLGLVKKIACSFFANIPFNEKVQEGVFGLIEAIKHYDSKRGRFAPYASHWIRRAIINMAARDHYPCRLNHHCSARLSRIKKMNDFTREHMNRRATVDEISKEMKAVPDTIVALLTIMRTPRSFDMIVQGQDVELYDWTAPLNCKGAEKQRQAEATFTINKVLKNVTPRSRLILEATYGIGRWQYPRKYVEIGRWLGLSRQRIQQIHDKEIKRLRKELGNG